MTPSLRIFGVLAIIFLISVSSAQAKLNVVATTADLASIAQAVGGAEVEITTLARPAEDPHFVDARPSFIVKINRADALIEGGAELENGWLTPLLAGARNAKLAPGAPGRIVSSHGVQLLEAPAVLDRSQGDVHAAGNPHFLTDPSNSVIAAQNICESFCKLDTANCERYRSNLAAFTGRVNAKLEEWKKRLAKFQGQRVVSYHNVWPYFARRFGLKIDLFLEPKPGVPPTPAHLAAIMATMKQEKINALMIEPFQNRKTAEKVAGETGAKIVAVTQYPGGVKGSEAGYIELMDYLVSSLAAALETP